jgi:hypothetical protein
MESQDENAINSARVANNDRRHTAFAEQREKIIAAAADYNQPLPDSTYFKRAYDKGARAQAIGLARVCPYYEDELREPYWMAGYDGIPFRPPMIVKQIQPGSPVPPRGSELGDGAAVQEHEHASCEAPEIAGAVTV